MNGVFYGTIQKVESSNGWLLVRCVRQYFHADGLASDDVWIWKIENPEEEKIPLAKSMIGKPVDYFEVSDTKTGQSLMLSIDDDEDALLISGKRIRKMEEPRGKGDLEDVVVQLSRRISDDESDRLMMRQKITAVTTFVEQKLDRIQRRAVFDQGRDPKKSDAFSREIDDLQEVLRKLKEPNSIDRVT